MIHNHYEWVIGELPPILKRHSKVKHALLREYLVEYFLKQDRITLTIVDGFCGGGRYTDEATGAIAPGSPIIILQAIAEAEARIYHEQRRQKPVKIDVELICIDNDKQAIQYLKWALDEAGFGEKLGNGQIVLIHGTFENQVDKLINQAYQRSRRSGKAIFVLDQYGYTKVPINALKRIFRTLAKAEVILTFNVDSLINFLCEKNLENFEKKTGILGALTATDVENVENKSQHNLRRFIQSKLYMWITREAGARYFTPFFIRPEKGHGDFWLLHLSQHCKARDVMTTTHWLHNNHFVHYGDAGLDMFSVGYAGKLDSTDRPQSSFEFDDIANAHSKSTMLTEIPRLLSKQGDGVLFGEFFDAHCNNTPATREMIEETILNLKKEREIIICDKDGRRSHVKKKIRDDHVIQLERQMILIGYR